ncbi:dienelactone hydrolase family protein [Penicillium verhagenii]|uniref:dienelactone hydrolase family protein n=1 Tax=Penicillium verhagenii TaxID=1562060 RepID=UPI0025454819|nr:dienelactone hydrolase family protein [Penicillium verhagenii]KAJ5915437.1 dienelactone hydrolase family protein [Penicillium verhagenii]
MCAVNLSAARNNTRIDCSTIGGEVLNSELVAAEKFHELDIDAFMQRNGREQREHEIFECARALRRELGFAKVGAVGYCYGGWASFRLGAREHRLEGGGRLVDCISVGHPSLLSRRDVDEVDVPVQVLAPEVDLAFDVEFKRYAFETLLGLNVAFEYRHFPRVGHGCLARGMGRGRRWWGKWMRLLRGLDGG